MPLGLGLGLGLQKPTLPPVSAWPTIADIPQGAVVLDVDGVVKQKWGDDLCYTDSLTDDSGEPILQNGEQITQIPYGTKILLNENNEISLNADGSIALGE